MYQLTFMVFLLLLSVEYVVIALEIPEELKPVLKSLRETCVEETGISADIVDAVNKQGKMTPDKKLMCYMKCIFVSLGVADDDANVDFEAMLDMMLPELVPLIKKSMEVCPLDANAEPCEKIYKYQECVQKLDPKMYYLP